MKNLKYNYRKVIQGNFGLSWEDMSDYDAKNPQEVKDCRADLREYRASGQGIYRLINRRELNPDYIG